MTNWVLLAVKSGIDVEMLSPGIPDRNSFWNEPFLLR